MKIKFNVLWVAGLLTVLLFLYTGAVYWDQTTQAAIIDTKKLLPDGHALSASDFEHLKKLGFSDVAITHMNQEEIQTYKYIDGEVVDQINLYRKITGNDGRNLSKKEYTKLLDSYSKSFLPRPATLERVQLKLVYEGDRSFMAITEHHFDYQPVNAKPVEIEIQLRNENSFAAEEAWKTWWTASSLSPEKLESHTVDVSPEAPPSVVEDEFGFSEDENEFGFSNEENPGSYPVYYSVPWKQSGLGSDTVAMHITTAIRFDVPEEYDFADFFVQGNHPYLSEHLQYEIKKK